MRSQILTRARSYYHSGGAFHDYAKNLAEWRRSPTSFRLRHYPKMLAKEKRYQELEELVLDPRYIYHIVRKIGNYPEHYREIVRPLFFKRSFRPDIITRVALIEQVLRRITTRSAQASGAEALSDYICDEFDLDIRRRFVLLYVLHFRELTAGKRQQYLRDLLVSSARLLQLEFDDENPLYDPPSLGERPPLESDIIRDTITENLGVILDHDQELIADLMPLLRMTEKDLAKLLIRTCASSRRDLVKGQLEGLSPIRLRDFGDLAPEDLSKGDHEYPLFSLQKRLMQAAKFERLGILSLEDLEWLKEQIEDLRSRSEILTKDTFIWERLKHRGSPLQILRSQINRDIHLKDYPIAVRDYFREAVREIFGDVEEENDTEFKSLNLEQLLEEWSYYYSCQQVLEKLPNLTFWGVASKPARVWAVTIAPWACDGRRVTFRETVRNLKSLKLPGWWLYFVPFVLAAKFGIWFEEREKKRPGAPVGMEFNFLQSFEQHLDKVLLERDLNLRQRLLYAGDESRAIRSDIAYPKKVISRICKRRGRTRTFALLEIRDLRKYEIDLPWQANPPVFPPMLSVGCLHRLRKFARGKFVNINILSLWMRGDLRGYEYTIPSRLYGRYFQIPEGLVSFCRTGRGWWAVPVDLFQAWQLKRAAMYWIRRREYYNDDELSKYLISVAKRFRAIDQEASVSPEPVVDLEGQIAPEPDLSGIPVPFSFEEFSDRLERLEDIIEKRPVSGETWGQRLKYLSECEPDDYAEIMNHLQEGAYSNPSAWFQVITSVFESGGFRFRDDPFFDVFTPLIDGWEAGPIIQLRKVAGAFWGLKREIYGSREEEALAPEMVLIPPGAFTMGMRRHKEFRRNKKALPLHIVEFKKPFYLGSTPVTVGQFRTFVEASGYTTYAERDKEGFFDRGKNGSLVTTTEGNEIVEDACWYNPYVEQSSDHPVVCVTRDDAQKYASWLSRTTGRLYRLCSESEWEYACRCGTDSPFFWGEGYHLSQVNAIGHRRDEEGRYRAGTTAVASCPANHWGLKDMHGNVWEIVRDEWHDSYEDAPTNGEPRILTTMGRFWGVKRGGSWASDSVSVLSGHRELLTLSSPSNTLGFRIAMDLWHEHDS